MWKSVIAEHKTLGTFYTFENCPVMNKFREAIPGKNSFLLDNVQIALTYLNPPPLSFQTSYKFFFLYFCINFSHLFTYAGYGFPCGNNKVVINQTNPFTTIIVLICYMQANIYLKKKKHLSMTSWNCWSNASLSDPVWKIPKLRLHFHFWGVLYLLHFFFEF